MANVSVFSSFIFWVRGERILAEFEMIGESQVMKLPSVCWRARFYSSAPAAAVDQLRFSSRRRSVKRATRSSCTFAHPRRVHRKPRELKSITVTARIRGWCHPRPLPVDETLTAAVTWMLQLSPPPAPPPSPAFDRRVDRRNINMRYFWRTRFTSGIFHVFLRREADIGKLPVHRRNDCRRSP
jgi:hypothetical protein